MKRKIKTLLLFLLIVFAGKAQEQLSISLFTDRDVYISGETLLLKVDVPATEKSGIVSIDLINQTGKKITGILKEIVNHEADGYIYLPDSLTSGCYLLRTSVKTSNIQTIKALYISNRFNGLPLTNSGLQPAGITPVKEVQNIGLQVKGIQNHYKTREKVHTDLQIPADLLENIDGNLLVNVSEIIPEFKTPEFTLNSNRQKSTLVDHEGIILEGTVTELRTAKPFKNALVYLSIPDSLPGFQYYITSDDGRFYFQIKNYYGKIPVVIQCYSRGQEQLLKIALTDQDSLKHLMPMFEQQSFPPDLRKKVERNADALTYRKVFNQQEITVQPSPVIRRDIYPFYGIPTNVVDPQLFIDLPNFTEISRELLPGVKFRAFNRIPTLQVLNSAQFNYFTDPPLVLFDGIPTRDLNFIKEMGSKDIDKIEICQNERFFGDLSFQGILAIYSTKADYSRIPATDNLIKLNLDVLQPQAVLNDLPSQEVNNPDLRQVLLWKPLLKPGQVIPIEFITSDIQGTFRMIVRGKTKDGSNFYKEQIFEVN